MRKLVHLFGWDQKFFPQFLEINADYVGFDHHYIVYGSQPDAQIVKRLRVSYIKNLSFNRPKVVRYFKNAEKIIIHGLFSNDLLVFLFAARGFLHKCYWVMWGGDLYHYQKEREVKWYVRELARRFIIRRLGHVITYIDGDYQLVKRFYGTKAKWHECLAYPSNTYVDSKIDNYTTATESHSLKLLVGNSADPSNRHAEIFRRIQETDLTKIKIYCPLSYGDPVYSQLVQKIGKNTFGDRFVPINTFMPFDKYVDLLNQIDIAIFNHNRQQAMGNIINLLGLKKKVFINKDVTSWSFFERLNIRVFDFKNLELKVIDPVTASNNRRIIQGYFSIDNLKKQWQEIYQYS
jgi:dTDP-N-acetylfucosamine:lipid II N-acetylfucosaminyltransferase